MRLTPPLNLPALGKRRSVYGGFDALAQTCVFIKQFPGLFHCDPDALQGAKPLTRQGTPSPEVTGLVCLVP